MNNKKKKNKQKTIYIDDGSSVADMSGLYRSNSFDQGRHPVDAQDSANASVPIWKRLR